MNQMSKSWLSRGVNFWFPRGLACIGCGEDLFLEAYSLCENCLRSLGIITGKICRRCGRPLPEPTTTLCYACFGNLTAFKGNVAVAAYSPLARQLIFKFKYKDKRFIGYHMAEMMTDLLSTTWISDVDCIVAVPSSKRRIQQRGFCQMGLISSYMSQMTGLPYLKDLLVRSQDTPRMKKLNREDRFLALKTCFNVTEDAIVAGKSILLLDDIMTTGATLEACSRAMLEAGAKEVYTLTFATVFDNQPHDKPRISPGWGRFF